MIPESLTLEQHDALGRLALDDVDRHDAAPELAGAARLLIERGEWQAYWLALVLTELRD